MVITGWFLLIFQINIFRSMESSMHVSACVAALTPLMLGGSYLSYKCKTESAVKERAFRLKYNHGQQRADFYSIIGVVVSGLSAPSMSFPVLPSMTSGLAAGCLFHILISFVVPEKAKRQVGSQK